MRIISIANQKGGCGKTTTAINLSGCLAHKGRKVLLVDMDPQGHSTIGLNIDPDDLDKTVCDALCHPSGTNTGLDHVVVEVAKNLDVAPSNISLSTFGQQFASVNGREARLREAIEGVCQVYDYIIIDCPPSLGLLTFNSLIASTEVLVPIEMSMFSLHGISRLLKIIDLVRDKTGHNIQLKVVATMYDKRTRISREVLQDIKNHFKDSIFVAVINTNVKLKEAASFGKSIVDYERNATGFNDYMALAKEVIKEERKLKIRPAKRKKKSVTAAHVKKQFLLYAPEANSVRIVGNFNDWNPSNESAMMRNQDGTWSTHIDLTPGKYQYRFLVDDTWVEDQDNPEVVDNPFGGRDSVLDIS
jgi:chromosome partitioning protein